MTGTWLLLSDVHLSTSQRRDRETAVAEVLSLHPRVDVVFLGDLFEFATTSSRDPDQALADLLAANPAFCAALRAHTATGAGVHWVAGNHDAPLNAVSSRPLLDAGLDVTVWPWFMRVGSVHLEHGHLFDRDNAPIHPLASWDIRDEPLGVALMRRIVVELDVPLWAHAHQTTPGQAVRQATDWFGWRLPVMAMRAFSRLISVSGGAVAGRWGRVHSAKRRGNEFVAQHAGQWGVERAALEQVLLAAPSPTHAEWSRTFRRLYLDWVSALGVLGVGVGFGLATGGMLPWAAAAIGGTYAVKEGYFRRESRYPSPLAALRTGAHAIATYTGAQRVVFGHTHVEEDDGVYVNLGSFGYANTHGRAYGLVTEAGEFTRRYLV